MLSTDLQQVATKAKSLYRDKYQVDLERRCPGAFVCIEPESGDYFLGSTLDEAVNQSIDAYPDRLTHTLRIGHDAALHLGVMFQ